MERKTWRVNGEARMLINGIEVCGPDAEYLAAYEETGLEPEEINRIVDAYGRGHTLRSESAERLEIVREIPTDRLRDLAGADVAPVRRELKKAIDLLDVNYEKALKNQVIRDPLAWALFRTWKTVNGGSDNAKT